MIQGKNITIVHKKDLKEIVKDVRFCLNPGDKAVIIGEEGNGKSTLLKWLYDPKLVEAYAQAQGERIFAGERLGYLPQELPEEDRAKTVYEYFDGCPGFWEQTPKELAALAGQLGLERDFFYGQQQMGSLSGGEKVKAQMAALLMERPTALLLDEPSNDIDIETLQWLEKLILDWEGPVLFISHDETLIEAAANMVIHMERIRRKTLCRCSVVHLPYREYVQRREENMDSQKRQAQNERREEKKRREKFQKLQQQVESDLRNVSRQDPHGGYLLKKKMKAVKSLEHRYERERGEMTEMPETEEAIFFKLGDGVKMPAGTYMQQNYEELLDRDETPVDYLDRTGEKEGRTRIRTWLGSLKFTADEMDHPIRELSGGQKAKVLLLEMSMSGADVLILDEPTRNFSPLSGPVIRNMLKGYGGAILSVSHDRKYMEEVCDTVLALTPEGLEEIALQ